MTKLKNILLKSTIAVMLAASIITAQQSVSAAKTDVDRDKTEIIVKYKDDKKADSVKNSIKSKLKLSKLDTKKKLKNRKIELIQIDEKTDINQVVDELKNNPDVEYVQPNYKLSTESTPADPKYNQQWGLTNSGQEIEGVFGRSGVDINAAPAWGTTTGTSATVVGVLDTGIDINHPDLKGNIYINTKEIPANGIDDDNNGYKDDINGWDFVNGDSTVYDNATLDLHGTYVAGIIAAKSDSAGITGVAPNIKVLPLKFINGNVGYTCDILEAIEYAKAMGIKIINCSFGGSDNNLALKEAMQNSGILFVCSAGNRGADVALSPVYPASFDIPNVLSVAAIDSNGVLADFTSYGDKIHVAAPGVNILSTTPDGTYDYISGTSTSAPFVTGVAALLKSKEPALTYINIAARIKNNVTICASLEGKVASNGRVNAAAALANVPPQPDTYVGVGGPTGSGTQGGEAGDDSWYTMDQLAKIKEKLHYGEGGVSPATGNFSFTCNDMTVNAPGFQVNISRTYNSKDEKSYPLGRGWTFGFEGSLQGDSLVTVVLPTGAVERFRKDTATGKYTPDDSRAELVKNTDGTFTLTTKDQYSYGFDKNGWLCYMKDRYGNTITIQVDASGKITGITDSASRVYTVNYNPSNGLIDNIVDSKGRKVKYEYNTNNYLIKVTDPMGKTMNYTYDTWGYLTEIKDHDSKLIETIVYNHSEGDNQHKVSKATDAQGDTSVYTYDVLNRKTTILENNIKQWVYWFDTSFYTTKMQDAEGKFIHTEYVMEGGKNKFGDVKSSTDRNGNTTQYERDPMGNVTKVINPDLSVKEYAYDDKSNLTMEKDESGKYTFYVYTTDKKNLEKKVQPLNGTDQYTTGCDETKFAITAYTYYPNGLQRTVTDPEGNISEYTYDAYWNLRTIINPEGKTTTVTNNIIGWKTAVESPKKNKTEYTYDDNGLIVKSTQKDETTRTLYDSMGRKVQEVLPKQYNAANDGLAKTAPEQTYADINSGFRYTYYDSGRIRTATDPNNNTTTYTYDVYGNILTETKPNGSVYRYEYDVLDRVKKVYFKDSAAATTEIHLEEYSYATLSDNKTQKTVTKNFGNINKAVTVYIYDYAGRLVEQQNPDGTKIKAEYNTNGTVKTSTDANGSITYYRYDGLNRLTEQWTPFEVANGAIVYTYTKTEYDKAGRKTAEKAGKEKVGLYQIPFTFVTKSYTYYKDGKVKTVTDSSGRKTEYWYDDDGNLEKEVVDVDANTKNITEYISNHLGKVEQKIVHVQERDIEGYSITSTTDKTLTTKYKYDKNGNLETVTTPDGIVTTYTYDNMNRQTGTSQPGHDENGQAVTITTSTRYNWEGKPEEVVDANGNKTTFEYNKRGFLVKTINAQSGTTLYYYDFAGRKVAEVSPKNYDSTKNLGEMSRVEYVYDSMDRLIRKLDIYKDPVTGQWVTITTKAYDYDNNGNVTREQDALGYDGNYGTQYTYNLANKPVTVLDPVSKDRGLAFTTRYEYDGLGRKISETNANGTTNSYVYDDTRNIEEIKVNNKTLKTNHYNLVGNVVTQVDGNGKTTTFEYNALGKVRKAVYPGDTTIPQNTVIYQYDMTGNLKKQQDSMGRVDLYTYDNQGRVLSRTQKKQDGTESITTSVRYDKNGNKRYETDANGITKENTYDSLNRLKTTKITVKGVVQETIYDYDANGNQTMVTDWRGNTYTNIYDPLNRLIEKKDPYTTIQKLEYNKNSVQVKSYDALNNATEYRYDKNNRLIATIDPEGHTVSQSYDNAGNLQTKTDGRGIATTYIYDEFNRLKSVVNAKGETTTYTYDLNGNMLTQTNGNGHTSTFEYNAANKVSKRMDHGGKGDPDKTETYTYYADGTLQTKIDRNGNTTTYIYDIHGRLKSKTIGAETISYEYDNNGNMTKMTDKTGTTIREYDELGRVTKKTVPQIGTTEFAYGIIEADGCTAETSKDPKGNITEKVYDKAGRLKYVIVDGKTTTYNYYANGSRQSVIYHNGASETYTYYKNNLNWTLTNKKADGSVMDTYTYTYDAANNQTSKHELINGVVKGTTLYTYDSLNRLETVTEPNGRVTSYSYDKAGNRLIEAVTTGTTTETTTYIYNEQNRLVTTVTTVPGTTTRTLYTYDSNGNMVCKISTVAKAAVPGKNGSISIIKEGQSISSNISFFEYDVWNQLVRTTTGDKTATYAYNGDGYRVEKTVNGKTTRYLYEYDKVVLEVDGQGSQIAKNVYGTNLLTRTVEGETYYYMYNGHADVTALLSTSGEVAATYYYDAFGNIVESTGNVNNPIRYAGYQWDGETGLYYLNARMYDPKIARFLQEDTVRGEVNDPLSLNLYTYVHNNPLMYYDPTGHKAEESANFRGGGKLEKLADIVDDFNVKVKWDGKQYAQILDNNGNILFKYDINKSVVEKGRIMISPQTFKEDLQNALKNKFNVQQTIQQSLKSTSDVGKDGSTVTPQSILNNIVAGGKDTVTGFIDGVKSLTTYEGWNNLATMMTPMGMASDETLKKKFQMLDGLARSIETGFNQFVEGNWNVKAYYISRVGSEVIITFVGTKGTQYATKVVKLGKAESLANVMTKIPAEGEFIAGGETRLSSGSTKVTKFIDQGWDMPKGGKTIDGRYYSEHALERMAPNTMQVRAELESRAAQKALEKGYKTGTKQYNDFVSKYVDPRGIPPSVVENAVEHGTRVPGKTRYTWECTTNDVKVIINEFGDVITVIPK
ncbi:MAG: S8 family serine peptidase [Clostridia bacterium]|nr:S8 family serine peptidase [Clostridia bacterium]